MAWPLPREGDRWLHFCVLTRIRSSVVGFVLAGLAGCGTTRSVEPAPPATTLLNMTTPAGDVVPAAVLAADDPLFVAMGLPDNPDEVSQILRGRHERLVAGCMAMHGFEQYVPESGDNTDGHLNAAIVNDLPLGERKAWLEAWRGPGDADHPGCVDQFKEQVYPLAAFPDELAPYLSAISDDPRFVEAGDEYDRCVATVPPASDGSPNSVALAQCGAALEEIRHAVYREQVLKFLQLHYDEVAQFGRVGAQR